MGRCKPNSVADQVKTKLHYTLKKYCELRELNYHTLSQGYISVVARVQLEKDGIDVDLAIKSLKTAKGL